MLIYKITNLKNNKFYIGCTKQKIKKRWIQHKASLEKKNEQQKLYNAMRKHGIENFKIEEIEKCSSIDEMSKREAFWIKELDAIKKGYNVSTKLYGKRYEKKENYQTMKKTIYSFDLETEKIEKFDSLSKSGFSPSKISQCANEIKERNSYKNKLWSYINTKENWERLKQKNKEKKGGPKKVRCIETNMIYDTAVEAHKITGIHKNSIRNVISGRAKTAGGYTWEFVE